MDSDLKLRRYECSLIEWFDKWSNDRTMMKPSWSIVLTKWICHHTRSYLLCSAFGKTKWIANWIQRFSTRVGTHDTWSSPPSLVPFSFYFLSFIFVSSKQTNERTNEWTKKYRFSHLMNFTCILKIGFSLYFVRSHRRRGHLFVLLCGT